MTRILVVDDETALVELVVNDVRSGQVLPSDVSTCPPM